MTPTAKVTTSATAMLAALTLAALTLAACSAKGTGMGPSDAPSTRHVAAVQTTLDTALHQVRDRLSELRPGMPWQTLSGPATAPCNTSDGPGGTWHDSGQLMATGVNASESEWPTWKATVDQVLASHGFTPPQDIAPQGTSHMLKYTNPEGDVFTFSANPRGTGIDASSSCFIAETP